MMDGSFVAKFQEALTRPEVREVNGKQRLVAPAAWQDLTPKRPAVAALEMGTLTGLIDYVRRVTVDQNAPQSLHATLSRVSRENERLHRVLGLLNRAHARTLSRLRDKVTDYTVLRDAARDVVTEAQAGALVDLAEAIRRLEKAARLPEPRRLRVAPPLALVDPDAPPAPMPVAASGNDDLPF